MSREPAHAGRRARGALLAVPTVLLLAGCGLLGTATEQEPEWAEDPDSGKYYQPGVVLPTLDLVDEHFPELDGVQEATLTEGRFTDPDGRAPIPAPDDYWWQAALLLEDEQVEHLLRAVEEPDASDGGGIPASPDTLTDAVVREVLVPTIEAEAPSCPSGWIAVEDALAPDSAGSHTAAGDMIQLAALCEDTSTLVIAANDM